MIDLFKISKEIQEQKVSVVCATCKKYWGARQKNIPVPKCLSVDNCASPIGGGTFHEYEGQIPTFEIFCIVCGEEPNAFLMVGKSLQKFGICDQHLKLARELSPEQIENHEQLNRYYEKDGKVYKLNEDSIFRKKTLSEQTKDMEEYIRNRDKKKFEV